MAMHQTVNLQDLGSNPRGGAQVPGSSPGWGASMKGIIMEKEIQEIDFTNGTEMPELTAAQICSLENPEYCEACQQYNRKHG